MSCMIFVIKVRPPASLPAIRLLSNAQKCKWPCAGSMLLLARLAKPLPAAAGRRWCFALA